MKLTTLFSSSSLLLACAAAALTMPSATASAQVPSADQPGDTRIAAWKDDKKAAFMMMFDDCCPTHVTNVHTQLHRRGMTGTYYIVGNKPERKARLEFWEKEAPASPHVVYGNHTMNHTGFTDVASAEADIVGCNELIKRVIPGKNPRLISYATPGGAKHAITQDEIKTIIAKHQLILRPEFRGHGAGIHFKTGADILRAVDKAMAGGTAEYVIFHGVGGDWLSFDGAEFVNLLDGIETRRGELWITDHVSAHKYETERATAAVRVLTYTTRSLRIELTSQADGALYDQPLTLVTRVPDTWKSCRVTQGAVVVTVPVSESSVRYEALPGAVPVLIEAL